MLLPENIWKKRTIGRGRRERSQLLLQRITGGYPYYPRALGRPTDVVPDNWTAVPDAASFPLCRRMT